MKDGITLHPEHGLNPSIEVCMICGEDMGIALLGNNIKGQAPHHICTGEICDNIILAAMCGDDAFMLNTKRGKGMQSTYRREKIVRTEKEFDINGTKVMAYSRKDAIKRLKHKK